MGKYYKEVNHTIYNEKVNKDIKIMLMTDIHFGHKSINDFLNSLLCQVLEYQPDYLLIGGDSYNDNNEIRDLKLTKELLEFYKSLSNICTTLDALGNHEMMGNHDVFRRNEELYERINEIIPLLDDKVYTDDYIRVVGKTIPFDAFLHSYERKKLLKENFSNSFNLLNQPNDKFNILLTHSPQMLDDPEINYYLQSFDLICSGHMHDGLLPPLLNELVKGSTGFISPLKELFPTNAKGTIKNNNQTMIISGGVTKVRVSRILDSIYPRNIDKILVTNDIDKKDYLVKTKYKIK